MPENLRPGDHRKSLFQHAVGSGVAVVGGVGQQEVVGAEQSEVDPPGIDAHAGHPVAELAAGDAQAGGGVRPLGQEVPIEGPGHVDRAVFESIDLLQPELGAVEEPHDVPPAGGPHVDRQICLFSHGANRSLGFLGS